MVLQRIVKAKNQRVKRELDKRDPKVTENTKTAMFIKGGRTSDTITQTLKEFAMLKKPHSTLYKKKNIMRPFDDPTSIEFFAKKADASLFLFGSHSKKRPNNIVIGRCFDYHVLDMLEFGIDRFRSMKDFQTSKVSLGVKPCLLFAGQAFDSDPLYQRLKNLFIDFFRGPIVDNVRLQGLEHVLQFTAIDGKIHIRSYRIVMKKSGQRIPRIELEEIGPALDLSLRRSRLASDDLYKQAKRVPKVIKPKKKKNVSQDVFGTQHGRIHMQSQDLSKLQTRKLKGLKRKGGEDNDGEIQETIDSKKSKLAEEET